MEFLVTLARIEAWLFIGVLSAIVAYHFLTGEISIDGLLDDKRTDSISPERIQLLIITLIAAAYFPLQFDKMLATNTISIPHTLPLFLFGGSHAFYLFSKVYPRGNR